MTDQLTATVTAKLGQGSIEVPRVEESSLLLKNGQELEGYKALLNPATGHVFNMVTDAYVTTTHEEILFDVEAVLAEHPEVGKIERKIELIGDNSEKLRATYVLSDWTIDIGHGDSVNPRIEVFNSYDGSWAKRMNWGALRLICSNGLVVGEAFATYRREHHQIFRIEDMAEQIEVGFAQFESHTEAWKNWVDVNTTSTEVEKTLEAMKFTKTEAAEILTLEEEGSKTRLETVGIDGGTNQWILYNVIMQYLTHKVASHVKRARYEARARRLFALAA